MKVGNLVNITRGSIGTPAGTIGLITKVYGSDRIARHDTIILYDIKLANGSNRIVRRLARDLEIIN